jgi:hypothetical protein
MAETGAPEEVRTPDPQIRSLEVASLEPNCEQARDLTLARATRPSISERNG